MREMIYLPIMTPPTLLLGDSYKELDFKIMSLGTHPCAYICIPFGHQIYQVHYSKLDIPCHGGLTYSKFDKYRRWWIGWDYAHCDDYTGHDEILPLDNFPRKQWTTREIYQEIKDVIDNVLLKKDIRIYEND